MLYVFNDFSAGGFCGVPFSKLKTERCNGHVIPVSLRIPVERSASACVQILSTAKIYPSFFTSMILFPS